MELSVVLITYKRPERIKKVIETIYSNKPSFEFEVVVVHTENDSQETYSLLKDLEAEGKIRLIINKENLGIGPTRNVGMKQAKGKYVLILDDDTEILGDAIQTMYDFMESHPNVGLCGAQLLNTDRSLQLSSRKFPTFYQKIRRAIPPGHGKTINKYKDYSKNMKVDFVIGACQFIRRDAMEMIGYYDEKIFSGPEDLDYCLRMNIYNWEVWYIADAKIVHHWSKRIQKEFISKRTLIHFNAILHFFHKYNIWFGVDMDKLRKKYNTFKN